MDFLNKIFAFYDQAIAGLSPSAQALISIALLIFLIIQLYYFIRSGHWLLLLLIIIFLPGTWPAARFIGNLLLTVLKFLLTRAQSAL